MLRIGDKRISFKALQTFEAVGEHLSMSRAAEALSVTQSAVSHQVKKLERELGVVLFRRAGRALALTADGERLHRAVGKTLSGLRHDVENFTEERFNGELHIAAPPTFTTLWLLPRFAEFRKRFAQLRYRFSIMPVPPTRLIRADIVVQFGTQYWPGKRVVPLVDTDYLPVCAPQLLPRRRRFTVADLAAGAIIHDDGGEAWDRWFSEINLGGFKPRDEIFVGNAIDALHMARLGYGFAINDEIVTSNWIASGELVQPLQASVKGFDKFYVVSDHDLAMKPAAKEFESWLRSRITS